mgnify:CR=1 FL=1|jgi:zinc transporter ZupT
MEIERDLGPAVFSSGEETDSNSTAVFWTKIGFIVTVTLEAAISGMIPTWSPSCRESPKVLGIANSFAGGVFMAIAFMHITPEMIETWDELNEGKEKIFPLPELLIFVGYTIILIIDKVLFDTHALFEDDEHGHAHDPAERKMESNVKSSMARSARIAAETNDPAALKQSRIEEKEGMEDAVKAYLNPHDRFATRMKASMNKGSKAQEGDSSEQ